MFFGLLNGHPNLDPLIEPHCELSTYIETGRFSGRISQILGFLSSCVWESVLLCHQPVAEQSFPRQPRKVGFTQRYPVAPGKGDSVTISCHGRLMDSGRQPPRSQVPPGTSGQGPEEGAEPDLARGRGTGLKRALGRPQDEVVACDGSVPASRGCSRPSRTCALSNLAAPSRHGHLLSVSRGREKSSAGHFKLHFLLIFAEERGNGCGYRTRVWRPSQKDKGRWGISGRGGRGAGIRRVL